MNTTKYVIKLLLIYIAIYAVTYMFLPVLTGLVLKIIFISCPIILFIRHLVMQQIYKTSIDIVSKQFIMGENIISNDFCMVKYTPNDKIVVIENTSSKKGKRTFTLKKERRFNINKAWFRLCRVYDTQITLDALASFFSKDTKIDISIIEPQTKYGKGNTITDARIIKQAPKYSDINNIKTDRFYHTKKTNSEPVETMKCVSLDSLEVKTYEREQEEVVQEIVDLGDLLTSSDNKIDINNAAASEISILPGINIVIAKKIVEFRDKNGLFKTVDDFLKVAEVKDHFASQIKPIVFCGKPAIDRDTEDFENGRIVDL